MLAEWSTLAAITRRTGMESMVIGKAVSSMVCVQKTVEKRKENGKYAEYRLVLKPNEYVVASVTIKLAFLKSIRDKLPVADRGKLDEIVTDYEHFLQVKNINKVK